MPDAVPDGGPGTGSGTVAAIPENGAETTITAPAGESLDREERALVQRSLNALGFDAGQADGIFGPRTRAAIAAWQAAHGLDTTGRLSRDQAEALAAAGEEFWQQEVQEAEVVQSDPESRVLYFAAAGPKCTGMPEGSACWRELANRPGCFYWLEYFSPSIAAVEWSGECHGDTAHGRGTQSWPDGSIATGSLMSGKMSGHWIVRYANGAVDEGPYVDGDRNGFWTSSWPDGERFEGEVREGLPNGPGTVTFSNGEVYSGRFRDGCLWDEIGPKVSVWLDRLEDCGSR